MDHLIDCSGCGKTVAMTDDEALAKKVNDANILCPECDQITDDTDPEENEQ